MGLVGIHHIVADCRVEDCRVLWEHGADCRSSQRASARLHANSFDLALHIAASDRRGSNIAVWGQIRSASDRRLVAEGRQLCGIFLRAVDNPCKIAKVKLEASREDPTLDAYWALWVDCMSEFARTFFSLHRTSQTDDTQARLSALRRKLASEQALHGKQMGMLYVTYGHLGDHSWHLRQWTRQPAAARIISLESELQPRCTQIDASARW